MNDGSGREKKDAGENLKLIGWLNKNRATVAHRKIKDVAEYAERELKFPVTSSNIRNLYNHLGIADVPNMPIPEANKKVKAVFDRVELDFGLRAS